MNRSRTLAPRPARRLHRASWSSRSIAIVARLAQVQLVQGETFAAAARENQIQLIPIAAPRGLIVDRHGDVMVRSRPSFVCALIPSEVVRHRRDAARRSRTSCTSTKRQLRRRLYHHLGVQLRELRPRCRRTNRTARSSSRAISRPRRRRSWPRANRRFPGVDLEEQPVRNYPLGTIGAQVFGYVGAITEDEYRRAQEPGLFAQRRRRQRRSRASLRPLAARQARRPADRGQRGGRAGAPSEAGRSRFPATRSSRRSTGACKRSSMRNLRARARAAQPAASATGWPAPSS